MIGSLLQAAPRNQQALSLLQTTVRQTVSSGGQTRSVGVSALLDVSKSDAAGTIMKILMDAHANRTSLFLATNADVLRVEGGSGNDLLSVNGSGSIDLVVGNTGNDVISVNGAGDIDRTEGNDGDDVISITSSGAGGLVDRTEGGSGNDRIAIVADGDVERLQGGEGNDQISIRTRNTFLIYGDEGNDTISIKASGHVQYTDGGDGNDTVTIEASEATGVFGGAGNDTIRVTAASIGAVRGGTGDDRIVLNNTKGEVSSVYMSEGDGHDIVETNGPLEIRRFTQDGTQRIDPSGASVEKNDDGTVTVSFAGSADTITVKFTGSSPDQKVRWNLTSTGLQVGLAAASGEMRSG